MPPARKIVLASSSPERRRMLESLQLRFIADAPDIDETARRGERAPELVARLSREKAEAVAARHPGALLIGSDQVAEHRGEIIGKPRDHEDAARQLQKMRGGAATLHAGVALLDAESGKCECAVEPFTVEFREFTDEEIERYLAAEKPYNCCGSLKAEGPGIALLKRLHGDDPNTLFGMPLIRLTEMLARAGVRLV
ncbi:MAG: Maf family nucleotide pyrophosphatase [Gammaproteobacteria bacterium]|nr:Maf family nucleotide pyrophosphatase [Gammaproteobacteria bacterium]